MKRYTTSQDLQQPIMSSCHEESMWRFARNSSHDDVGGDGSHDEIQEDEDVVGESIVPIIDGRVGDSSCADAEDLSEHPTVPSVVDSMGKTLEPFDVSIGDMGSGVDNLEGGSVNVSIADDTVSDAGKQPSVKNLGECVDPSVKDNVDGLKESVPIRGDEARPTVNGPVKVENVTPSVKDTTMEDAEGMKMMDVPSAAGTHGMTRGREDVTPSVTDTGVSAAGQLVERTKPTSGEGLTNTLNADREDLEIHEDAG
ncbi:hypothetical protein LIER_17664 [Lithospermum erythrorhizon]|uniref:Uncharacterized protein n=1 Tax=Lithospermum erythrorhizon TaxID=34254 RepID=A0AAV3QDK0_LITER